MATINPTNSSISSDLLFVTWSGLTTDDVGAGYEVNGSANMTVQILGDFGGTGSVSVYGSNDPRVITDPANAVWFVLTDKQGNAITKTAAAGEAIQENPRFVRPEVTLGTTPDIDIILCVRK